MSQGQAGEQKKQRYDNAHDVLAVEDSPTIVRMIYRAWQSGAFQRNHFALRPNSSGKIPAMCKGAEGGATMPALVDLPEKASIVHVAQDFGGEIFPYQVKVQRWRRSGTKVRVSGECASACTLVLSLPKNQLCFESGASLGFHEGSTALATTVMWAAYPQGIKSWLKRANANHKDRVIPHISLTQKVLWLSGEQLRQREPRCN